MQEAARGAERGARGGQDCSPSPAGTKQGAGAEQRQGELAEESGGPAGTGGTRWGTCRYRLSSKSSSPYLNSQ